MQPPASKPRLLRFGIFEVDLKSSELRKAGMRQKLGGQPFQVLQALLECPGEVVTREQLRALLWPDHTLVDYDLALKKAVNRLREAPPPGAVPIPPAIRGNMRRRTWLLAPGRARSLPTSPLDHCGTADKPASDQRERRR